MLAPPGETSPGGTTVTPGNARTEIRCSAAAAVQPALSLLGELAHVLAQVDASRPGLPGETDRLRDCVPAANDEATTPLDQRVPQIGQGVEEERDPARRTEAREDVVVEDEERHDLCRVRPPPHEGRGCRARGGRV